MKKLLPLFLLFITTLSFSQQTYYSDVNLTLTGTALRDELATKIINTHSNFLSYSEVWESSKVTDLDPDDLTNSNVLLIYGYSDVDGNYVTDRTRNKNLNGGTAGTEWNREHTYAKSLGNPDLGTSGPGSDAHQLRPSDITLNGQRGSLKFAAGSGTAGGSNGGWYPGEEWKGDVARMMMYMYLRYGSQCYPSGVAIGSTNAIDANMIDLLLDWNAADPVSQLEDNRNTYHGNISNTYAQGNRNPFIDNPNLATQIWGGTVAEDRWNVTPDTENPTNPTDLAGTNITNTSVDLTWTSSTDNIAVTSYEIYVNDGGGDVLFGTSTTTSTTLTGLTINTTYDITVYAKDAAENTSGASNVLNITTTNIIDNTAPSVPTNLVVSNETTTSIDISWTASTDDQAVKEYDVYVDGSYNATTIAATFTVDGLTASTTYSFSVLARDTSGNESSLSVAVDGTTTDTPTGASELFISEYVEGSSNNKAIEITNFTGSTIADLSIYSIKKQVDGAGSWVNELNLSGSLTNGSVYVIANSNSSAAINALADQTVGGTPIDFNGNDPVGLFKNDILIDIVGAFNAGSGNFAQNITLRRKSTIYSPNTTYTISEWDSFSQDNIDDLGIHSLEAASDTEIPSTISDLSAGNITSNSAYLSWTAATDNIGVTYYEIYKDGVFLASSPTNSYAVSGLSSSTSYDFTVYAKDAAGNTSLVSNTETFTTLAGSSVASELFISEYVEGSSNNKAIEIANFTGSPIDLSIYSLKRDVNGGGWGAAVSLSGNLSSGSVFVVANSSASAAILSIADLTSGADALLFNGNDAVGLFKNNVLIDLVGTFGSSTVFAEDITLRRKPTISSPNTTYTVSEWDTFATDTFSGLGNHTLSSLSVQEFVENLFNVYPNPTKTKSVTISVNNNETISAVQLYNLIGQLIIDIKNPNGFQSKIEVTDIPLGFYIVKVFNEKTYSTKRLIVE